MRFTHRCLWKKRLLAPWGREGLRSEVGFSDHCQCWGCGWQVGAGSLCAHDTGMGPVRSLPRRGLPRSTWPGLSGRVSPSSSLVTSEQPGQSGAVSSMDIFPCQNSLHRYDTYSYSTYAASRGLWNLEMVQRTAGDETSQAPRALGTHMLGRYPGYPQGRH